MKPAEVLCYVVIPQALKEIPVDSSMAIRPYSVYQKQVAVKKNGTNWISIVLLLWAIRKNLFLIFV